MWYVKHAAFCVLIKVCSGHLDCFHVVAIVNPAAVDVEMQLLV